MGGTALKRNSIASAQNIREHEKPIQGAHLTADGQEKLTNYITSNDLFSDFSSNTIEKLYEICDIIPFRENDTIVQQGEEASWVGFLIEGDLSIIVSGREVARQAEGEIIGELSVLEGGKRTATCIAARKGQIAAIKFDVLDVLHEVNPELSVKLHTAFGISGVAKLRSRLSNNVGSSKSPKSNARKSNNNQKDIDNENKTSIAKRRKRSKRRRQSVTFSDTNSKMLKSNAGEIFYRVQVIKAQQEAKLAEEERLKHMSDAERMKRRANTADIVRKKLSRENDAMKEELDALRKFKAASLAINASRAFAIEGKSAQARRDGV